jgi:hypothetical protein
LAIELEKNGITREDLKAANVQTLEDLNCFIELLADQYPINRSLGDQEQQ